MRKNEQQLKQVKVADSNDLMVYYNDLKKYKPLNRSEERNLLLRYKNDNDLVARQKLITSNLRYAFSMANKYRDMGVPLSDLVEEANCGLIQSIDEYDIERDVKVITYAKWKIMDNLQTAVEKNNKLQFSDLPEEYETQMSDEALTSGIYSDSDYSNDAFAEEDEEISKNSAIADIDAIITVLNEREVDFIKMYYGIKPYYTEFTYEEIGKKYNITKERVRQIIDKIMRKLRVQALTILQQ